MADKKPDKLAEIFNIPALSIYGEEAVLVPKVPEEPETPEEQIESDFNTARDTLLNAVEISKIALTSLKAIADGSQHPRAFEAMATLIEKSVSASKDLLDLHQKKKDLTGDSIKSQTINNNLVISTNDLLKMIKGENK